MLNFKPSNPPGDLADSSDDLEGMVGNAEKYEDSDVSDDTDSDDDIDAEEIADVGEESGKPNNQENPFFNGNDDSEVSDTDDDSDMEDEKKAKSDEQPQGRHQRVRGGRPQHSQVSVPQDGVRLLPQSCIHQWQGQQAVRLV